MSTIETRCPDCGYSDIVLFTFRGIQPPLEEDDCPRCLQPVVALARIDPEELGADTRAVPRAGGGWCRSPSAPRPSSAPCYAAQFGTTPRT